MAREVFGVPSLVYMSVGQYREINPKEEDKSGGRANEEVGREEGEERRWRERKKIILLSALVCQTNRTEFQPCCLQLSCGESSHTAVRVLDEWIVIGECTWGKEISLLWIS